MAALWWIRRDLRLTDNPALTSALRHGQVIPVFVLDPALQNSDWIGSKRWAFLLGSLKALDQDLQARGSYLVVRNGPPLAALQTLMAETGAKAIYAQADVSPFARERDAEIATNLPLTLTAGQIIYPAESVLKADGKPYTVFTPYSRRWKARPPLVPADLLPAPEQISTPNGLSSEGIPSADLTLAAHFAPGEAEALNRLAAFTNGLAAPIYVYREQRDFPAEPGTSSLSPYLRFGVLSARQAAVAAFQAMRSAPSVTARDGAQTWLDELIWREFYSAILYHFPQVRQQAFRPELSEIAWENNEAHFAAWCLGNTGYPIVDAAMRQLAQTGWMHNRCRMIVASFLVKDLLIDWRWGERHFMQHLIDGDPAANNGGWQWSAGTGTDAAPYFRIFNPSAQSSKFDPDGRYIQQWVPELRNMPPRYWHAPWEMPSDVQQMVGCVIGRDYPAPIVDHAAARERTLAAYAQAKADYSAANK